MSSADRRETIGTPLYWFRTWPRRYAFAVLMVGVATLLRYALSELFGPNLPFLLFFPTILLVAWIAGLWPGIFAVFLSAASVSYLFFRPAGLSGVGLPHNANGLMLFSIAGVVISGLADMYRRRAERLREFERAAAGVEEGIIVLDRDYRYVVANRAFLKYRGVKREELIGRSLAETMGAGVFETTLKPKLDECFQGKVVRFEKRFNYPAVGERDFSVSYFPIEGPTGVERVACILQDITEQKEARTLLEQKELLFRTLVESAPMAMVVSLGQGQRAQFYNPKFSELFGYTRDEVPDIEHWWPLACPDPEYRRQISELWNREVREAIESKSETRPIEARVRCKDGSERDVEFKLVCAGAKNLVFGTDITEIRRSERALKLFRTLIDQSNDAVEVIDPETKSLLDVNEKACKDLGYTREELLSLTVYDLDPNAREACHAAELRDAGPVVKRTVHRRKDGSTFPVETSLKYVALDRNYVVAVSRDISDRKKAEDALRESEDRYRDLIEHSEDLVCTHDLKGNFLSMNPAPARVLGYEVAELMKIPMRDVIAPEFRARFDTYLAQVKKNGADKGMLCVVTRSGERRIWEYNNTLRTEGVTSPIVRGMAHDVTERKRVEAALRQSEADLNRAQTVAHIGSWRFDIQSNSVTFSDETYRIAGLPIGSALTPSGIVAIFYPDDQAAVRAAWKAALGQGHFDSECRILVRGVPRWIHTKADLEFGSEGRPLRAVGTVQDITERRRAEDRQREYERVVESVEEYIIVVDRDYRYIIANRAFLHYRGLKREQVIGHCVQEVVGKELFETVIKRRMDACFEGKVVQYELRFGSTTLGERDLFASYFPIEGPTGVDRIACVLLDITERKQAQEALRNSEENYRNFVTQSSEGIFRQDLDAPIPVDLPEDELVRHILYDSYLAECNDAISKMYGLTVKDFVGKRLTETLDPNDPHNIELTREYIRSGFRVVERESHEVDIHGNPKVFLNSMIGIVEKGMLLRTWGIQRDVTERVRLEEARSKADRALQASETHFRLLVEQASDGIFIADGQGKCMDVNSAGAEMLGYTRDEMLRLSIPDLVAPEDVPRIAPELARVEEGATIRSEWMLRRKDGSTFPGEVSGKQLPDGRLQGILRDITERRQAEEAMRRNEERFRVALKDSPITVFSQDRDLRYTWIYNPQLYWQDEAMGKTDEEIIGPKKAARLVDLKRRVLKTGVALREEVAIPHNGKSCALDITIEPLFDADGGIVGITGASVDIARLREMTDRLQDARDKLAQEKSYLEGEIQAELGFEEIIGQSPALCEVLKKARVVAPTDSTVLLLGETGTGKELVARSVHSLSSRRDKTFIKLNCAAVPSGLLESELFGHEKGAFTSAVSQKVGRIELADKGTLFLDEIGELPLELQPKLLRVLQDREFERLGGVHTLHVDVRIISATNRDLHQDIADKKFREDLFYRLNVFPIDLPALRERRTDIPILVHHFVRKHSARMGKRIDSVPDETMDVLQNWSWPGNIRELENMIERMVIMTKGGTLAAPPVELDVPQDITGDNLTEMEREHIIRVLRETNGVLSGEDGAASRLGIKRTTLQSMLKRFSIDLRDFRTGTGTGTFGG